MIFVSFAGRTFLFAALLPVVPWIILKYALSVTGEFMYIILFVFLL